MKVTIRTHNVLLTDEEDAEVRRRLVRSLERISPWIVAADLTIADINGPKGGVDKQCRLHIRGRSIPRTVVEHAGTHTLATVANVVQRAEQTVLRRLARLREFTIGPRRAHE